MNTQAIRVTYTSIDGVRKTRTFTRLENARKWAVDWIGPPDIGAGYAVSYDGVGRITVSGCSLETLFYGPPLETSPICNPPAPVIGPHCQWDDPETIPF